MQDVAIFWDYENCPAPSSASGYAVANGIRLLASAYGPVTSLKAYLAITAHSATLRSELQASGVSLTDCAPNGRKEVADKMIIVDMLAYAMDHPAPRTLVLISGDRDYAYALAVLRLRQYHVVLVTLPNAHASVVAQASACVDWYTVVGQPVRARSPEGVVAEAEVKVVVAVAKKTGAAKGGVVRKGTSKKGTAKKRAAKKVAALKKAAAKEIAASKKAAAKEVAALKKAAAKEVAALKKDAAKLKKVTAKVAAKKGAAKKGAAKKAAVGAKAKAASKGKLTAPKAALPKAKVGSAKPAGKAPATQKKVVAASKKVGAANNAAKKGTAKKAVVGVKAKPASKCKAASKGKARK